MQVANEVPQAKGQAQDAPRWNAYAKASACSGLFAIVLGTSVLAGGVFGIEFLKSVVPGFSSMKPNTALFFVALGVALSARSSASIAARIALQSANSIAAWCSALVITLSACTLIEYGAGLDLGIDQLLFQDSAATLHPGRMAPATALAFLALSLSLVTASSTNRALIDPRSVLSFIALSIAGVALIGYGVDPPALSQFTTYASVAVHTAIGLIVLSCGALLNLHGSRLIDDSSAKDATSDSLSARPSLRLTIISTFGLLAVAITGSILLFLSVIKAQDWVEHTLIVQKTGESLLGALRDAETGQRGYIVTGDQAYLEPYEKALKTIPGLQAKLFELTADNPDQQIRLNALGILITQKSNELKQTVELKRTGNYADASSLIASNLGKAAMDNIREDVGKIVGDENALLDQRQLWLQRLQNAGLTVSALSLLLTFSVGMAVANMLYNFFNELQVARSELSDTNKSLDQIVVARTAELAESEQQRRFALEVAELGDWKLDLGSDHAVRSLRHDQIFGYDTPPDPWGFEQFIDHVVPEDREYAAAAFETAIAKHDDWRFECRIRRHGDGAIRWIDVQGKHYDSKITGSKGLLGTVADITERKLHELALATSNRRLNLLSRVSNDLIVGQSPHDLLKPAFDAVADEVGAKYYFNYLVEAAQPGWLELRAAGGLDDDQKHAFGHIEFGQHLCGRVAQTRQAIVLENIDLSVDPAAAGVRAMGIRSYAGMPLSAHGQLFGTLAFGSTAPRFDSADIQLITSVSDQFAATLDRTELIKAVAESEERQRLAISAAAFGTWDIDLKSGKAIWSNEHFTMLGYVPDETGAATIDKWHERVHPGDLKTVVAELERAKSHLDTFSSEHRIVRADDGAVRWLSATGQLQTDSSGQPHRFVGVVRDITANKDAEQHQQFLMRELAHRSKNLLAVIQSLAGQTARNTTTVPDFSARFAERLRGLAASQDLLLSQDWRGAPIADLVRSQLAAFIIEGSDSLILSGPNVSTTVEAAEALGLALHELATNASKYGALSSPNGKITVTWAIDASIRDDRKFHICWVESGGPPASPPSQKGFGNVVIERMVAASLNGTVTLTYPETGICWKLDAPASSCIVSG